MLSTLNVISSTHNTCEDSVFTVENEHFIHGVIADGCSTGIKSHFASQLLCYLVEHGLLDPNGSDVDITSNDQIWSLKGLVNMVKTSMNLGYMNLLSTCLLFTYVKEYKQLKIRCFGDGYYSVNDVEHEINQNNTPDYLAYHLHDGIHDFKRYLAQYPEITFFDVDKFMITSDGINNIQRPQFADTAKRDPSILYKKPDSANYLARMWNILKNDHYYVSDDLTIVSYG